MEKNAGHERGGARVFALSGLFLARPRTMLRVEGATLLVAGAMLYWAAGGSWWLFALLLLAPDVSMLGYLVGPGIGAVVYNVFHAYPLPVFLAVFGLLGGVPLFLSVALVWLVHIGLDRLLGYGLKYPDGFKNTHLGRM